MWSLLLIHLYANYLTNRNLLICYIEQDLKAELNRAKNDMEAMKRKIKKLEDTKVVVSIQ